MKITHEDQRVETWDYCGGMVYKENKKLYQGKELEDKEKLHWYDFHARRFDSQLGRWHAIDPVLQFASPYVGMGNNPVVGIDPSGMVVVTRSHKDGIAYNVHLDEFVVTAFRDDGLGTLLMMKDPYSNRYWSGGSYSSNPYYSTYSHGSGGNGGGSVPYNGPWSPEYYGGDGNTNPLNNSNPKDSELIEQLVSELKSLLGVTDINYYGVSIEGTITAPFGIDVEYARVHDPITDEATEYYSYGWAFGLEGSYGVNFLFLLPKDNFEQSEPLNGTSQGFSLGWVVSFSLSGNSTFGNSGDSWFDSYYLVKVGVGGGYGGSYTPRNTTKIWNGF